jgi:hypothetical protein
MMDNSERKKRIEEHQAAIAQHREAIDQLKSTCPHHFEPLTDKQLADQWMSVGAVCTVCRQDFGWRCKKSPDGVCHYLTENKKITLIDGRVVDPPPDHDPGCESYDWCVFCGHPEERK